MSNPFWNGRDYNPIISVNGVSLPVCPSSCGWDLEDLSDADAGRSEDGWMHKNRIGQIRRLSPEWRNIPIEQAQRILKMFNPEYVTILFIDPLTDPYYGYRREEIFYTGNRSAALYNAAKNIFEKVSFNLISQIPDVGY